MNKSRLEAIDQYVPNHNDIDYRVFFRYRNAAFMLGSIDEWVNLSGVGDSRVILELEGVSGVSDPSMSEQIDMEVFGTDMPDVLIYKWEHGPTDRDSSFALVDAILEDELTLCSIIDTHAGHYLEKIEELILV